MTPKTEHRLRTSAPLGLHLGCGETLAPLVSLTRGLGPGPAAAGWARGVAMPRLGSGVLCKR
jgi:hypothetical protein